MTTTLVSTVDFITAGLTNMLLLEGPISLNRLKAFLGEKAREGGPNAGAIVDAFQVSHPLTHLRAPEEVSMFVNFAAGYDRKNGLGSPPPSAVSTLDILVCPWPLLRRFPLMQPPLDLKIGVNPSWAGMFESTKTKEEQALVDALTVPNSAGGVFNSTIATNITDNNASSTPPPQATASGFPNNTAPNMGEGSSSAAPSTKDDYRTSPTPLEERIIPEQTVEAATSATKEAPPTEAKQTQREEGDKTTTNQPDERPTAEAPPTKKEQGQISLPDSLQGQVLEARWAPSAVVDNTKQRTIAQAV